jgi:hypothetical protein
MKKSELKTLIKEVIEEGKGDVSKKMRRRKAQKKYKRRELEKMKQQELTDIAIDMKVMPVISTDTDEQQDVTAELIEGILEGSNE